MKTTRMDNWCAAKVAELKLTSTALLASGHPRGWGKIEDALRAAFELGAGVLTIEDDAPSGGMSPDIDGAIEVRFLEAPRAELGAGDQGDDASGAAPERRPR